MKNHIYNKVDKARRLLVLDLGFLGDTVHLLPAIELLRANLPAVTLDVMVADHVKNLLDLIPSVNGVLGYPRFPKGPKWYRNGPWIRKLRSRRYDVVINLNGSDRSSLMTWATGAPLRLGNIPANAPWFKRKCFTHLLDCPKGNGPVYQQRWNCLHAAGFPGEKPEFKMHLPKDLEAKVGELLAGERGFLHVSPFTTEDKRELPLDILASFLNRLNANHIKTVLSHAPNEREHQKMEMLKEKLAFNPFRLFEGNLSLCELAGIVAHAGLHFGGDSGALHVALMTGCPTVSWFMRHTLDDWMPRGDGHETLVGEVSESGLRGIQEDALWEAMQRVKVRFR